MVGEARNIGPIGQPSNHLTRPQVGQSAERRMGLASRLLDNRLLWGYLVHAPVVKYIGQTRDLKASIVESLSYSSTYFNPILDVVIAKVDRQLDSEILAKANLQLKDFHAEMKAAGPLLDVEGFFGQRTFGQFDPQQYLLVSTLGSALTIMHQIDSKGVEMIKPEVLSRLTDRAEDIFEKGYTLLRAAEIASRQ